MARRLLSMLRVSRRSRGDGGGWIVREWVGWRTFMGVDMGTDGTMIPRVAMVVVCTLYDVHELFLRFSI